MIPKRPDDFDPMVHEFVPRPRGQENGRCNISACGRGIYHHFHTGEYGPECGCQDCMPLVMETSKLNRPRAWLSRIINR